MKSNIIRDDILEAIQETDDLKTALEENYLKIRDITKDGIVDFKLFESLDKENREIRDALSIKAIVLLEAIKFLLKPDENLHESD